MSRAPIVVPREVIMEENAFVFTRITLLNVIHIRSLFIMNQLECMLHVCASVSKLQPIQARSGTLLGNGHDTPLGRHIFAQQIAVAMTISLLRSGDVFSVLARLRVVGENQSNR